MSQSIRHGICLLLLVCTTSYPAVAATISGSDDTRFIAAVEAWLNDDDAASLPALSRLAKANNTAARLLLARIEVTDRAPSQYLRSLGRTQWRALFRAPQDPASAFAPGWLSIEKQSGNELAQLLFDATALGLNLDRIQQLIAIGEAQAAEHLIRKVAVDGTHQQRDTLLARLPPSHELTPYLTGFRQAHNGLTTGMTALRRIMPESAVDSAGASVFVDIGYQAGDRQPEFDLPRQYRDAISHWVTNSAVAKPLATLCERTCKPAELASCTFTAFGLMGGYYEIIRLDSPLESLISQTRFSNSERAVGMVKRRIRYARTETGNFVFSPQELRDRSACLATAAREDDVE